MYLPLQQLDMIRESKSWLFGTINSILTKQRGIELLVNVHSSHPHLRVGFLWIFASTDEVRSIEFYNPMLEQSTSLTCMVGSGLMGLCEMSMTNGMMKIQSG